MTGRRRTGARAFRALLLGAFAAALIATAGAGSGTNRRGGTQVAAAPQSGFLDVRAPKAGRPALPPVSVSVERAQARLRHALGRQAVVQADPLTGTPRIVAKLDGFLTAPSRRDPARIVLDYVARRPQVFLLDRDGLRGLRLRQRYRDVGGTTHLIWAQTSKGIPLFDNDLRASVARDGRIVNIGGSPHPRAAVPSTSPKLGARAAVAAAFSHAGAPVHRLRVSAREPGARRATRFRDGSEAKLVLFGMPGGVRLAWRVEIEPSSTELYVYVVDAADGSVLWRDNLVESADGLAWDYYPTNQRPAGVGTQTQKNFPGADPDRLISNNAHTYADVMDDNTPTAGAYSAGNTGGDEIPASNAGALQWNYAFAGNTTAAARNCDPRWACSWNSTGAGFNWETNLRQNATQAQYYVNTFHDHLLAAPIGFTEAAGNFQTANTSAACNPAPAGSVTCKGGDAVNVEVFDGAATAAGLPDGQHRNNANMATLEDGKPPKMQMYLFVAGTAAGGTNPDANGGDDASVVYHEYTHGMTNRLVRYADGTPALGAYQSGAMGEAWSDWYALDYLVGQGFDADTATIGDVQVARFLMGGRSIRTEPTDCPSWKDGDVTYGGACPGGALTGHAAGYTYADIGSIRLGPEVHADGEVWAQTVWQLRQRLVATLGAATGVARARTLVTRALELSPPQPTFLDMRNAILQADTVNFAGADLNLIWQVFANRGMGWFASAWDANDGLPHEDFALPPAPGSGQITGTVTDDKTNEPVAGAFVSIGGHASGFPGDLSARSNIYGDYTIKNIPAGTYRDLIARKEGYERRVGNNIPVTSGTTTADIAMRRDWAALSGGAAIESFTGPNYSAVGCGPDKGFDLSQATAWGTDSPTNSTNVPAGPRRVTLRLPAPVDIENFAVNPANTCRGAADLALSAYQIETSVNGQTWSVSSSGPDFVAADNGHLNLRAPAAGTSTYVRYVRISALDDQGANNQIAMSELEIYGKPSNPPLGRGTKSFFSLIDAADFDQLLLSFAPFGKVKAAMDEFRAKYGTLKPLIQLGIDKAVAKAAGDIQNLDDRLDDLDENGDPAVDYVAGPLTLDIQGTISPHANATLYDITLSMNVKLKLDDLFRLANPVITIENGTMKDTLEFTVTGAFKLNTQLGEGGFSLTGNDVKIASPSFKVEADFGSTDPNVGGDTTPIAFSIGPLGVTAKGTVKADAGIDLYMKDPNQDGKITLGEMTSTPPSQLFHFNCSSGGAQLALSVTSGLQGLQGQIGTVSLNDGNLCNGIPAPTITLNKLGDFRSLTAAQLVTGLAQITRGLRTIQETYDLKVPFLQKALADVVRFNEGLVKFFVDNGLTDPNNPMANVELKDLGKVDTLAKFAPLLAAALGIPQSTLNVRYDAGQLLFDVNVSRDPPPATASGLIQVGDDFKQVGLLSLKGSGQTSIDPKYDLKLTVGVDLTAPAGTDLAKKVYFRTDGVEVTADGPVTADLNLTGRLEPVSASVADSNTSGPVTLLRRRDTTKPMLSVDLQGYGDNRLTLEELADSFTKATPAASVGVNATIPATGLEAKLLLGSTELASGGLTMTWPDITKVSGADTLKLTPDSDYRNGPLQLAFNRDPLVLLRLLLQTARDASGQVEKLLDDKPVFASTLPVVGGTPRDFAPFFADLRQGLDDLLADNLSLTLPGVQTALRGKVASTFGLTATQAASILKLRYEPAAGTKQAAVLLELDLDLCTKVASGQQARCSTPTLPKLHRTFNVRLGGAAADVPSIVGLAANGVLDVNADAKLHLAFGVELPDVAPGSGLNAFPSVTGSARPVLLDSTSLSAGVGADVAGQLGAQVGPLLVSLGNTAANDPASGYFRARVRLHDETAVAGSPKRFAIPSTGLTAFLNRLVPDDLHESSPYTKTCQGGAADACLRMPVYLGSTKLTTTPITFKAPNLLAPSGWTFTGVTELLAKLKSGKLNWEIALEGIDALAALLEGSLANVPPGTTLPLIGGDVGSGAKLVKDFRTGVLTPLKTAVATFNDQATVGNLQQKVRAFFADHLGSSSTVKLLRPAPVGLKAVSTENKVATFTTVEPHGFVAGELVKVEGVQPTAYNATRPIKAIPSPTTFTVALTTNPDPGTAFGTATSPRILVRLICTVGTAEQECDSDESVTNILRAEIGLPLGKQGELTTQPFDIGFPGLRLGSDGNLSAKAGWAADLTFGIDRTEGFYLASRNRLTPGEPELRLETGVDFPAALKGEIAFLPISIVDGHSGPDAALRVGVELGGGGTNERIGLDQLRNFGKPNGWTLTPKLAGCVNAKLGIETKGAPGEPARLPSVLATLGLAGGHNCPAGGLGTGAPQTTGEAFKIGFTDVRLDLGSWFRDFFGPSLQTVNDAVAPLRPIINAVRQPIPGVADLARQVGLDVSSCCTWYALLKKYNDVQKQLGAGDQLQLLDRVIALVDVVSLVDRVSASGTIPLGSFEVDTLLAKKVQADPAKLLENMLPKDSVITQIAQSSLNAAAKKLVEETTKKAGFTFPAFQDPKLLFGLLIGKDPTLVRFDAGTLHAQQGMAFSFPLGPVVVSIGGDVSVDGRFVAGFDTFGVREAMKILNDGNPNNDGIIDTTGTLLQGLYVDDRNEGDEDVPEIVFGAKATVAATLGASIEGGIDATVDANLHVEATDGKLRYPEVYKILSTPPSNPVCLFDASGRIGASLAVVVPPLPPFPLRIPIAQTTVYEMPDLTKFCQPVTGAAAVGSVVGDTLVVKTTEFADRVKLAKLSDGRVQVEAPGGEAAFGGVAEVYVDGKGGADSIAVLSEGADTAPWDLPLTLCGGTGNDKLIGGPGTDELWGDGGGVVVASTGASFVCTSGDGNDVLVGNGGFDALHGGKGSDWLYGDGADVPSAGRASTDYLSGGPDEDYLRGGPGSDTLSGGSGIDIADFGDRAGVLTFDMATRKALVGAETDVVNGIETVRGGSGDDKLTGSDGEETLDGAGGKDTIDGAKGNDTLVGGAGDDLVQGGEGDDTLFGSDGNDRLVDGAGNDKDRGQEGSDTYDQEAAANGADSLADDGTGGGDTDKVDWSKRTKPVSSTADGLPNDGESGEGDNVASDVEGAIFSAQPTPSPATVPSKTGAVGTTSGPPTCSFDAASATVRVTIPSIPGSTEVPVARLKRSGAAIQLNGASCGAATVTNTDLIRVTAAGYEQKLIVDESGGPFIPGKTPEASGLSEIELSVDLGTSDDTAGNCPRTASSLGEGDNLEVVGTLAADKLRAGDSASRNLLLNLNGDDDADLTGTSVETLTLVGGADADELSGEGGLGAGTRLTAAADYLTLDGGYGQDKLTSGDLRSCFYGGPDNDTEIGSGDTDTFFEDAVPNGADHLVAGGGPFDAVLYDKRTTPVFVTLDALANDGAAGERDFLDGVRWGYVVGGSANDVMSDKTGSFDGHEFQGGLGSDTLTGGISGDDLYGCWSERFVGRTGFQRCVNDGNDILTGGEQGDYIYGQPGNDKELGGPGSDSLGLGVLGEGPGSDSGADDLRGGDGKDLVDYSYRTKAVTVTMADELANDGIANEHDNVHSDVENLHGANRAPNVLTGNASGNNISGGIQKDLVKTLTGDDRIDLGGGSPTLGDEAHGGPDDDVIYGSDAADALYGESGKDFIDADGEDDLIFGGPGDDLMQGEYGDDTFVEEASPNGGDEMQGEKGIDTVDYTSRTTSLKATIDTGPTVNFPYKALGNDGAVGERDNITWDTENILGGSAPDDLTGSNPDVAPGVTGANFLAGNGGADTLNGIGGDDLIEGGAAADNLTGGLGNDTVSYQNKTVRVVVSFDGVVNDGEDANADNVSEENDKIGTTFENIRGGKGNDLLVGDAGANTLEGGPGNDFLPGTARGRTTADGADRLIGDAGVDTVDYGDRTKPLAVTIGAGVNDGEDANGDGTAEEGDEVAGSVEILLGGKQDDLLIGSGGNETIKGGPGDDRIDGGLGQDNLFGEDGSDTAFYASHSTDVLASLDGLANDGEDVNHDDVSEEKDKIATDVENLEGGGGNDRLFGNAGPNVVRGAGKDDLLDGRLGADLLTGGAGFDKASYEPRASSVTVTIDGAANDGVAGENDNVTLDTEGAIGGSGDDKLTGSPGGNRLEGREGDDTLVGGAGADSLDGQDGDDTLDEGAVANGGDTLTGGANVDTLLYSERTKPVAVSIAGGANDGEAGESDNVSPDVEVILGGKAADVLVGGAGRQTIKGGTGDDRLDGGAGPDDLFGEEDADTAFYASHSIGVVATLDGQANDGEDANGDGVSEEKDKIEPDVENLEGGGGDDRLTGNDDANVINGAGGRNILDGGLGPDVLKGPVGYDTATYADRKTPVTVTIDGVANDGVAGENDNVHTTVEAVIGGLTGDRLTGGAGAEYLEGRGGADVLAGGASADELSGGSGDDVLDEGPAANGADLLRGGDGSDEVRYSARTIRVYVALDEVYGDGEPGEGDNVFSDVEDVTGGGGNDAFYGSELDNVLEGGGGDDTIRAGAGSDRLVGGPGADSLSGEAGPDVIDEGREPNGGDGIFGGYGLDTVDYSGRAASVRVTLNFAADDGGDSDGDGTAEEKDNVGGDTEVVLGGSGNDYLAGSDSTSDRLFGNEGDDTLDGGRGNDRLFGGPGNDTITGGPACPAGQTCSFADADNVQGGDGDDTLVGGFGSDYIAADDGNDTIRVKDTKADSVDGGPGTDRAADFDFFLDSLTDVEATCPPSCS